MRDVRVVMVCSNAHRPDPRVARVAQLLAGAGYRVTIIAWDRRAELPAHEQSGGVEIRRVHAVGSAYAVGWRQLSRMPKFWSAAVRLALPLEPDVVHCHDLDTLPIGWMLKRRRRCALVYDAHEHYPAVLSLYLPRPLVWGLRLLEARLLPHVDAAVTASTVLCAELRRRGVSTVAAAGNFPEPHRCDAVTEADVGALRARLGVPAGDLLVGYIGGFTRDRLLAPFLEAAALLPEVQCHLWGDGPQRPLVEAAVGANVRYHGWLPAASLPMYFRALDVVYYGLRTDYAGARYAAPNALGWAMAAGRPIVATAVGDLGVVVAATQCGVLLHQATAASIAQALRRLAAPSERRRLGANGLRAARAQYNAAAAAQAYRALYHALPLPRRVGDGG